MRLDGNVAVVTGGNGGIGEAIALKCAEEGASVVIVGRNEEKNARVLAKLEALEAQGTRHTALRADLTAETEVEALMGRIYEAYGRIDTLVNNAGIFGNTTEVPQFTKPFDEILEAEWDTIMTTNVKAPFFCCKHVARYMKEQRAGSIINVSSSTAWMGAPMFLHYGTAKGALIAMTKGLAVSLAPYNIRVNTICPGQVFTDSSLSFGFSAEATGDRIKDRQLLQTVTQPEDMAGIAVYLASEESRIVTGQAFGINGGSFLH
ncbi:MAG: SDR family oxidoreductase [Coriobacteriia bacterium]|nr:SDR family oxidoreductase [Coriobacteriia bacterium]